MPYEPFHIEEARTRLAAQKQAVRIPAEQWAWQKKLYRQQQEAGKVAAKGLTGLVGQYNTAFAAAKAANEQRYREMLGITEQTTGQRAADIRAGGVRQKADIMQQLARQGMAGTTVAPTMQMGVQRETESSLNRLADMMQGTKLGIMERRTDRYPDQGALLSLLSSIGQGSGGFSGAPGVFGALSGMKLG